MENLSQRDFNIQCPVCRKSFQYNKGEFRPFCTQRCKDIDLGKWFIEKRAIPSQEALDPQDLELVLLAKYGSEIQGD